MLLLLVSSLYLLVFGCKNFILHKKELQWKERKLKVDLTCLFQFLYIILLLYSEKQNKATFDTSVTYLLQKAKSLKSMKHITSLSIKQGAPVQSYRLVKVGQFLTIDGLVNNINENFLSFRAPQDHDRFAYAASSVLLTSKIVQNDHVHLAGNG